MTQQQLRTQFDRFQKRSKMILDGTQTLSAVDHQYLRQLTREWYDALMAMEGISGDLPAAALPEVQTAISTADMPAPAMVPQDNMRTEMTAPPISNILRSTDVPNEPVEVAAEPYIELFAIESGSDDLSTRLRNQPIDRLDGAMGFNERIYTINELFNGDAGAFAAIVAEIDKMDNYESAKNYLIKHAAQPYDWQDESRAQQAKGFIQLVHRRFAKSLA